MQEFFAHYLVAMLVLLGIAIVLTIVAFRRRWFQRGYRKGEARDPERVRRENPRASGWP